MSEQEIYKYFFQCGMAYALKLNQAYAINLTKQLYPTLKQDEEPVCLNAIVVMDSNGNLSYFNKDKIPFLPTHLIDN